MEMNKSQGQSLKVIGIDLWEQCFSHGQLYLACSRAGSQKGLYMLATSSEHSQHYLQEVLQ